jgi:hypothetical protein
VGGPGGGGCGGGVRVVYLGRARTLWLLAHPSCGIGGILQEPCISLVTFLIGMMFSSSIL